MPAEVKARNGKIIETVDCYNACSWCGVAFNLSAYSGVSSASASVKPPSDKILRMLLRIWR